MSGVVVVSNKGGMSHNGIKLTVDGEVTLQLSAKSVGLFEAFYNSLKPIKLIDYRIEVRKPGKLYPPPSLQCPPISRCLSRLQSPLVSPRNPSLTHLAIVLDRVVIFVDFICH